MLEFQIVQFRTAAMKTSVNLTGKSEASLAGSDALDLYLEKIAWNLRTMMGQADVLETVILETKRKLREHIAMESEAAAPQIASRVLSNIPPATLPMR